MKIKQRIDSDLKIALLAGDKDRVTTLRGLKSSILNAEIAGNARDSGLSDDEITQILNKEIKKRVESAEMYIKGGSPERANKELQEKTIINAYLPAQLSDEELNTIVRQSINDLKPSGIKDMGKVIGAVKDLAAGQANNARIAESVREHIEKDQK